MTETAKRTDIGAGRRMAERIQRGRLLRNLLRAATYMATILIISFLIGRIPDNPFGATFTVLWISACIATLYFIAPSRLMAVAAPAVTIGVWLLLRKANSEKSGFTSFPLMALDIRMFLSNPSGTLLSIGVPARLVSIFNAVPYLAAAAATWAVYRVVRRLKSRELVAHFLWFGARLAISAAGLYFLIQQSTPSATDYAKRHMLEFDIWEDVGLVNFAAEMGIVPFLLYSQHIESEGAQNFLTYTPKSLAPPQSAIQASAGKYLKLAEIVPREMPDIVVVHAESTFDPNDAFALKSPIRNDLFYTHPRHPDDPSIHFRGPGIANIIGGMSWVSEYEVILGIDSRLFGISGRYTHAALSYLTQNSFPLYLRSKGYSTYAFSSDDANFYNYETAYKRYGFQLVFPNTGKSDDDVGIMKDSLSSLPTADNGPILAFIALHENHAPHWCNEDHLLDYQGEDFVGNPVAEETCALREYSRRARSSERSIEQLRGFLDSREKHTGRPYVLAIYGDHQPYSFTGGGGATHNMGLNLDRFRTKADKRLVTLSIVSSMRKPISCCGDHPLPLTLLPTLLSAYVASSVSGLYLPQNLYQIDKCGSDFIGELVGASFYGVKERGFSKLCPEFDSIVASLKASNVVGTSQRIEVVSQEPGPRPASSCGRHEVTVIASGTGYKGLPEIVVSADETDLGTAALSPASKDSGPSHGSTINFQVPKNAKLTKIIIRFINDLWEGKGKDRNIAIHDVRIDGVSLPNSNAQISHDKISWLGSDGVLQIFSNGSATYRIPPERQCS